MRSDTSSTQLAISITLPSGPGTGEFTPLQYRLANTPGLPGTSTSYFWNSLASGSPVARTRRTDALTSRTLLSCDLRGRRLAVKARKTAPGHITAQAPPWPNRVPRR
jgi:hypothetical protein